MLPFDLNDLPEEPDAIAPDGSEIRFLKQWGDTVSIVHCTLPVGMVSAPVHHKTIEEMWFFVGGEGEVWRKDPDSPQNASIEKVSAGKFLTIPTRAHFQFKNTGDEPLTFVIATLPAWPGDDEAVLVDEGGWQVS